MKFTLLSVVLACTTLTLAATLPPAVNINNPGTDNGTLINRDVQKIGSGLDTLYAALIKFKGDTNDALSILQLSSKLEDTIDKAAKDAKAATDLTRNGTRIVALSVAGLQTNIFQTLDVLVKKKTYFENLAIGNTVPVVEITLNKLKNSTDSFAAAITPKFRPTVVRAAPLLIGNIDFNFNQAIAAYAPSSSS